MRLAFVTSDYLHVRRAGPIFLRFQRQRSALSLQVFRAYHVFTASPLRVDSWQLRDVWRHRICTRDWQVRVMWMSDDVRRRDTEGWQGGSKWPRLLPSAPRRDERHRRSRCPRATLWKQTTNAWNALVPVRQRSDISFNIAFKWLCIVFQRLSISGRKNAPSMSNPQVTTLCLKKPDRYD